jgi:hypothetical protein
MAHTSDDTRSRERTVSHKIREFFTEISHDLETLPQEEILRLIDRISAETEVLKTFVPTVIRENQYGNQPLRGSPSLRRAGKKIILKEQSYGRILKGSSEKGNKRLQVKNSKSRTNTRLRKSTSTTNAFKAGERSTAIHWMKAIVAHKLGIPQAEVELDRVLKGPALNVARDLFRNGTFSSSKFEASLKEVSDWEFVFSNNFKSEDEEKKEEVSGSLRPRNPLPVKGVQRLSKEKASKATAKKRFAKARKELQSLMIVIDGWQPVKGSTLKVESKRLQVSMVTNYHFAQIYNATLKLHNNAVRSGLSIPSNLPTQIPKEFMILWLEKGLKPFQQPQDQGGLVFLNIQKYQGEPLKNDKKFSTFL